MKKLLLATALMFAAFFAAGCAMWPNLNKDMPVNGGWVMSNVAVTTPWGTFKADLIKSVENANSNVPPFVGARTTP